MKMIINQKKYDTETATEIGSASSNCGRRDFRYFDETLYQKKTGEFFLAGEGGPMTKYREEVDNHSWTSGSRIIPLTLDKAKDWVAEHCSVECYEELFGPAEE